MAVYVGDPEDDGVVAGRDVGADIHGDEALVDLQHGLGDVVDDDLQRALAGLHLLFDGAPFHLRDRGSACLDGESVPSGRVPGLEFDVVGGLSAATASTAASGSEGADRAGDVVAVRCEIEVSFAVGISVVSFLAEEVLDPVHSLLQDDGLLLDLREGIFQVVGF